MKKIVFALMMIVSIGFVQAEEFEIISYSGFENYLGVLRKTHGNVEKGTIDITNTEITMSLYGRTQKLKVVEVVGNKYKLEGGNVLTVNVKNKEMKMDMKKTPKDEFFYYTYIYHID